MTFEEAIKHNGVYESLLREADNRVHSYMIVTSDTVTSELCAITLISAMTHLPPREIFQKDVYFLPEGDKVLKDDSDFVTQSAYIMPTTLEKKFFVIRRAETANETAQNKLLKTLEEPPETAVIILLCANEYAMLPTVRSRCRVIRPTSYSDEILREIISEEYPSCTNTSFVIAMSGGNLDKLKAAAECGTQQLDFALEILMCMRKSGEILPYAVKMASKKDKLAELLEVMELILRDCMAFESRPTLIKLKDNVMDIKELSSSFTPEVVLREMPVIARAKKRISAGGNVNSIVDELLFSLLEEKVKCQR